MMPWDNARFMQALRTKHFGREFRFFEQIDSTNRWLLANEVLFQRSGATVIADHQTSGRGRLGREWHDTPEKSLLFSVLLRPEAKASPLGFLSLMAGVAVAHSIVGLDEHLSERVRVKWPNDILVDEHKIAGILLESVSVGARFCAVLGIGINLLQSENELPRDTRWPASSLQLLSSVSISREELLGEILHRLEAGYDLFQAGRTEELTANWSSLSWPVEIEMTVVVGNKTIEGSYAGIGKEGQLLLKQHGTDIQEIYSGEIVRKGPRNE